MGRPQIVLEPANQITLDELCEVKTKTVSLAKYGGKTITYRTMIPLDVSARLQAQHLGKGKKDLLSYFRDMLKYALVGPVIETDAQARALVKADSAVMLQIIGEVSPQDEKDIRDALEDEGGLGESLGGDSPA